MVLPETGAEGARVFIERLADHLERHLQSRGVAMGDERVRTQAVTFPDDGEGALQALRMRFAEIDRRERPETPAA